MRLARNLVGTGVACLAIMCWSSVQAQQYRSQVREVQTPASAQKKDPATLLKSVTDPYAKALLLRELAAQAASQKDYKKAARLLEQALSQKALSGPAEAAMRRDLAALTVSSGDLKKAIPELERQVRAGNAIPQTMAALGAAYIEQKRFAEAIGLLQKAIKAQPNADIGWQRALVAAYMGAGRHRAAAVLLEKLIRRDPGQKDDWLRLSALYLKAKDRSRAQAIMEVANRLGHLQTKEDRLRLVTLTGQIGAPFEAGSLLQAWIGDKALPSDSRTRQLLVSLWVAARENGLALSALQGLIATHPSKARYEQLAQLHLDREEYALAARALEQAMARGGADGALLLSLGLAKYQQADIDGAISAFERAGNYAAQKALASDWLAYLESGRARELAMVAAAEARARQREDAILSERMLGQSFSIPASASGSSGGGFAGTTAGNAGGGGLTPVGALRDGSADGAIPAWTGGITAASRPADYRPGKQLVDPYASDKPLFVIDASNAEKYRARLSKGHRALLRQKKGYRMPVYPTRRSVSFPGAIYNATQKNHKRARLSGADTLEDARLGFPFPQPQSGVEVMWNHRVRYRGDTVQAASQQIVVGANGKQVARFKRIERAYFRYGNIQDPADIGTQNILLYYLLQFSGPSLNNFLALLHETANAEKDKRAIWVAPPGIGRLFRVPPVGYDQLFPGTDGIYFIDMIDMYNGPFDRYVWKLVGRTELYVPYNGYRLSDGSFNYEDLLTPGFLNPDATRYELHRVWVVEATERGGKRHSFGLRTFYVDEDSWNVVMVENHDRKGALWRFQEGHLVALYDVQAANSFPIVTYDLKDGRYLATRLTAEERPMRYDIKMTKSDFLPAEVKAKYTR
ncbi:MAG: DUF1329 domain-containing protein [Panacagrimonas sp.]